MNSLSRMGVEDGSTYSATKKAEIAEKEAAKRIQAAENRAHQAGLESDKNLSHMRDQFQQQYVSEEAHQEALLEYQRLKGYENLKNLQISQNNELSRVRQEGDNRLNTLQNYYRDTKYATETQGNQDLKNLEVSNELNLESTKKTGTTNLTDINEEHLKNTAALTSQYEDQEVKLKLEQDKELDRKRTMALTANEMADVKFQEHFEKLSLGHQETVNQLEAHASKKIQEIRQETSDKLAIYGSRQRDPFYKMMDLSANLSENENGFTLKLRLPEHEQKNISVSIKGDNLVVMGQRRNEEILDRGDGVTQGTATFQSYHESFPLSWPVDSSRIRKEFNGEEVTIRVPKKNKFAATERASARPKNVQETAQFPQSIQEFYTDKQSGSGSKKNATKGSRGSGPLT